MASMYTSSNEFPLPNVVATQCRMVSNAATETIAAVAKGRR